MLPNISTELVAGADVAKATLLFLAVLRNTAVSDIFGLRATSIFTPGPSISDSDAEK